MLDVHVHLSKSCARGSYFVEPERAIAHLDSVRSGASGIRRFAVFPHHSVTSYDAPEFNLSLTNVPSFLIPFFRFRLRSRYLADFRAHGGGSLRQRASYLRAKWRNHSSVDEMNRVIARASAHGVRGFKFHDFQDGTLTVAEFERMLRTDAVWVLHVSPRKIRNFLEGLGPEIPAVSGTIMLAHFGYSLHDYRGEVADILWLANHAPSAILFDSSFVQIMPFLRPVLGPLLPRLTFGSDFPAVSPDGHLVGMLGMGRLLGFSESQLIDTFERNSARVESSLGLLP